jgi:hypothetical protein
MRGFMKNFEADPVVKNMKDHFRLYPLGEEPKEVNWVNVSMKAFNTLHPQDITVYDNQTRSLVQTDQPFPGVTSIDPTTVMNADGSCDVYIGPKKPVGSVNWIQSIPGMGWNLLWRIYGPTQVWYDKKWRPSEIEMVK